MSKRDSAHKMECGEVLTERYSAHRDGIYDEVLRLRGIHHTMPKSILQLYICEVWLVKRFPVCFVSVTVKVYYNTTLSMEDLARNAEDIEGSIYYGSQGDRNYNCALSSVIPPPITTTLGVPDILNKLQAGIVLLMGTLSLLLGISLLYLVVKYPSLRRYSLLFAIQVVLAGVMSSVVTAPAIFVSEMAGSWVFGSVMCNIVGFIQDGTASLRIFLTAASSFNFTMAVFSPSLFKRHRFVLCVSLSLLAWMLSLLRVLGSASSAFDCYAYVPELRLCTAYYRRCSSACSTYGLVWLVVLSCTIAASALLYGLVFIKEWKTSFLMQRRETTSEQQEEHSGGQKHVVNFALFLLFFSVSFGSIVAFFPHSAQVILGRPNSFLFLVQGFVASPVYYSTLALDAIAVLSHKDVRKYICLSS